MTKKCIGQRELARLCGLSPSTINYALKNTSQNHREDTVRAIEKALGLKKGDLL